MHADLVRLLDLQGKDAAVGAVEQGINALRGELAELDQALQQQRDKVAAARRAAADGTRRRDDLEAKVESFRLLQERRSLRLEHVRDPKEASNLMAELDLARAVLAKDETEWVRSAEAAGALEVQIEEAVRLVEVAEAEQAPARADIEARRLALESELQAAVRAREASAAQIDKVLRGRYDRLRRSRSADVVVPLLNGACGACHTAIPLSRRSQIRNGTDLDGCEVCGVILYPPEPAGSP